MTAPAMRASEEVMRAAPLSGTVVAELVGAAVVVSDSTRGISKGYTAYRET